MIAPLLCGMMLIVALMRVAVPIGQQITGDTLGVISLRFRERLRLQRVNAYLIGAVLLLGTIGGWLRTPLNLVIVLAFFVIVSIPAQYTITTDGVARNRTIFRQWDEFTGIVDERGRIVLRGGSRLADLALLLAPDQHAEAMRLLAVTPLGKPASNAAQRKRARQRAATKMAYPPVPPP